MCGFGKYICAIFLYNFIFFKTFQCQSIDDTEKLYNDLIGKYNKNIRGNEDQSEPTYLAFIFHASNLVSFDEVTGTLSLAGWFTMIWRDERMEWDPEEYDGIESINFPQDDVWIPTIVLSNSQNEGENLYLGNSKLLVRYTSDGTAFWYPGHLFKSFCAPNVRDYPFDHQVIFDVAIIIIIMK